MDDRSIILDRLIKVDQKINQRHPDYKFTEGSSVEEIGDSLDYLEFIVHTESEFQVEISEEALAKCFMLGDLISLLLELKPPRPEQESQLELDFSI